MKTIGNIFKQKFHNKNIKYQSRGSARLRAEGEKSDVFDFIDLVHEWRFIIGENLSKVTSPMQIKNKSLTILTSHPAFSQQLTLMENEIISKIKSHFPKLNRQIKKIFFVTNPEHFKPNESSQESSLDLKKYYKKNKLNKFSPQYQKLRRESEELFEKIEDTEMKSYLSSIYIQLRMND